MTSSPARLVAPNLAEEAAVPARRTAADTRVAGRIGSAAAPQREAQAPAVHRPMPRVVPVVLVVVLGTGVQPVVPVE